MKYSLIFLLLGNECSKSVTPSMLLNELCEFRSPQGTSFQKNPTLTFGWLLQICLRHLPFSSEFITLLRELELMHKPLKVSFSTKKNYTLLFNSFVRSNISCKYSNKYCLYFYPDP